MNSHPINPGIETFPLPFPDLKPLAGLFGFAPIKPGFYGYDWGNVVLVTTNHQLTLGKIGQATSAQPITVLAMDAGGFGLADAIALGGVDRTRVESFLSEYERAHSISSGRLLVPYLLARKFGWSNETRLGRWSVRIVPGKVEKLPVSLKQDETVAAVRENHLPAVFHRVLLGLRLWLLQALVFAVPLFVFGWQSLAIGISALLVSALLLSLAWPILPGRGWMKGLALGILLTTGLAFVLRLVLGISVYPAFGLLLTSFWMGIVFSGAKS